MRTNILRHKCGIFVFSKKRVANAKVSYFLKKTPRRKCGIFVFSKNRVANAELNKKQHLVANAEFKKNQNCAANARKKKTIAFIYKNGWVGKLLEKLGAFGRANHRFPVAGIARRRHRRTFRKVVCDQWFARAF